MAFSPAENSDDVGELVLPEIDVDDTYALLSYIDKVYEAGLEADEDVESQLGTDGSAGVDLSGESAANCDGAGENPLLAGVLQAIHSGKALPKQRPSFEKIPQQLVGFDRAAGEPREAEIQSHIAAVTAQLAGNKRYREEIFFDARSQEARTLLPVAELKEGEKIGGLFNSHDELQKQLRQLRSGDPSKWVGTKRVEATDANGRTVSRIGIGCAYCSGKLNSVRGQFGVFFDPTQPRWKKKFADSVSGHGKLDQHVTNLKQFGLPVNKGLLPENIQRGKDAMELFLRSTYWIDDGHTPADGGPIARKRKLEVHPADTASMARRAAAQRILLGKPLWPLTPK